MGKIRSLLKRNEIYFTTICASLLSLMAIIISLKSCEISERQYSMEYFEKQPDFQIQESYIKNTQTNNYDECQLIISKISGKAKNINVDIINFIDFDITDNQNTTKNKRLIRHDFYNTDFLTGTTNDTIQISTGHENHRKLIDFEDLATSILKKKYQFVFTELKTYVKISYLNFENKSKCEYYDVEFLSGKFITDSISGEKIFKQHDTMNKSKNIIRLNHPNDWNKLLIQL